jgi:hypothetical protein
LGTPRGFSDDFKSISEVFLRCYAFTSIELVLKWILEFVNTLPGQADNALLAT